MKTWDDNLKYGFSTPFLKVGTFDGHNMILLETFTYTTKDGTVIPAEVGMGSDGASVPSFLWSMMPPFGVYWMAAFLHDVMYRYLNLPKDRCDSIFLEAMELLGTPETLAHPIYEGVHFFGWNSFKEDRIKQMEERLCKV